MTSWLRRTFHDSWRFGPFYLSTWDWQRQHQICYAVTAAATHNSADTGPALTAAAEQVWGCRQVLNERGGWHWEHTAACLAEA